MTPHDFDALLTRTLATTRNLLAVKGGEYAADSDRLANFRSAGARLGVPPELILLTYLDKHYSAVCNYIRDQLAGKSRPRSEPIEGRVHDIINYCILYLAILDEGKHLNSAVNDEGPRLVWDSDDER